MAMHSKLKVGDLITTYSEIEKRDTKYVIIFKALYVKNRRERTSGTLIPGELGEILDRYGVRRNTTIMSHNNKSRTHAIGCRTYTYYSTSSSEPYITNEIKKKAAEKLDSILKEYESTLYINDFVEEINKTKTSNKEMLFVLDPTITSVVRS